MSEETSTRRGLLGKAAIGAAAAAVAAPEAASAETSPPIDGTSATFSTRGAGVNGVVALEEDGAAGISSWTPGAWRGTNPPMRMRMSRAQPDVNGGQHFMVVPYEYGTAIEYNGTVECWVNEWSIHNNSQGGDREGAVLWVGNHDDTGGLMISSFNRNGVKFTELISQLFTRESGGDMRFIVRGTNDKFEFRAGPSGDAPVRFQVNAGGDAYSRFSTAAQVRTGAAGPGGEAGVSYGSAEDVRQYRHSSTVLRCDQKLTAQGGIGVGNSVAASRTRSLARKMEVFDAAGNSLGFVPIYSRID